MPLTEKHMDLLTQDNIEPLLMEQPSMSASLYMPSVKRGNDTQQNPVRLKNLLRNLEAKLQECGLKASDALDLTAPAKDLIEDSVFWSHQSNGLALFLGRDSAFAFRLPMTFDERFDCGTNFNIKPLLPLLYGDGRFYVLVLSKGSVKLLQGSRFTVSEIDLGAEAPSSLKDILGLFDFEESMQWRETTIAGVPGRGDAGIVYHGHGGQADEANMKERLAAYLRRLDDVVCDRLNGEKAPMVLAGVEYVRAFYRDVSHYSHLVDRGISGNFDQAHLEDLARKGWEIVSPKFQEARRRDFERLHQFLGASDRRGIASVSEIVTGAWSRRVETLFVPLDYAIWGQFDPESMTVEAHELPGQGDQDLLNLATVYTLRNGGTIYGCAPEEMPPHAPVAAILW